ncbi:MAG: CHASE3 domain-containing protein [Casimicrobiaceae bacterium]
MKIANNLPHQAKQRLPAQLGFVVLGLAAVFNLAALSIVESSHEALQHSARDVEQSQRVARAIDGLRIRLLEAETGQRGFIVTGDDAYLDPYRQAQRSLVSDLDGLQELVVEEPVQATQLATVRRLVGERLDDLEAGIDARRRGGLEEAVAGVLTHGGKVVMDTLRAALDGMMGEEARVQSSRVGGLTRHARAIRLGVFAEALLNLLLVTLGAIFLWRELGRHKREHDALEERGATLETEVRERTAQLTELSRFQEHVREDEKKRVARELHDELGGTLTAAKIDLQLISDRLKADAVVAPRLARISAALDDAIAVKRRIIEDLRPTLLDNLGISAALRWQCDEFAKRNGCVCVASCPDGEDQPSPEHSVAIYRIVQEALTNISKYAQASRVEVDLIRDGDEWRLRVTDNGIGLEVEQQHKPTSHGLISIRERARTLGGHVVLTSGPGKGTAIEVVLPAAPVGTAPMPDA